MNRCTDCRHLTGTFQCGRAQGEPDLHAAYVLGNKAEYLRCAIVRERLPDYSNCPKFEKSWMNLDPVAVLIVIGAAIIAYAFIKAALL